MSICGHTTWCGPEPHIVRLTDNGVRKVQVTLESQWGKKHRFVIAAALDKPDVFMRELEAALIWTREGGTT